MIMRIGNNRKWKREKKENKGMWDQKKMVLIESQSIIQTQVWLIFVYFLPKIDSLKKYAYTANKNDADIR